MFAFQPSVRGSILMCISILFGFYAVPSVFLPYFSGSAVSFLRCVVYICVS